VAGVAVGFLAVLFAESLSYLVYLSDPLYHLHALDQHNRMPSATVWFWNPEAPWSGGLMGRLLRDGPTVIFLNTEFGLFTAVALLAIAYGLYRKAHWPWFVSVWFVYHVLIFNFGSHSLRAYMPLPAWEHRYFYPLLLPAALLVAALLDTLLRPVDATERKPVERLFWGATLGVIVLLGCAHGLYRDLKEKDVSYVERSIARIVPQAAPLYTDARSAWLLRFFRSYPAQSAVVDFAGMEARDIPPGSYVLVNPARVAIVLHYGYRPPAFLASPPVTWERRWENGPARLYSAR
jgi:hypothetical protein